MRAVDVDPFWRVRERAIQSKPTEQNSEWAMNDDDDEHGPEKLSCAVGGGTRDRWIIAIDRTTEPEAPPTLTPYATHCMPSARGPTLSLSQVYSLFQRRPCPAGPSTAPRDPLMAGRQEAGK